VPGGHGDERQRDKHVRRAAHRCLRRGCR
jgi:hypothetical protein